MSSFYGFSTLGSRFGSVLSSFAQLPGQPFLDALPEQRLEQLAQQEQVSFGNPCNSIYTPAITTWTFLLQVSSASKCCVAAVARLGVLMTVLNRPLPSAHSGGYCKARSKLPAALVKNVLVVLAAHEVGNRPGRVEPRRVKRWQQKHALLRQPRHQARAALLEGRQQEGEQS